MKSFMFYPLMLIMFSLPACAQSEIEIEEQAILETVISKYEEAIDYCTVQEKNRPAPDNATLQKLSKIDNIKVKDYIRYRFVINYNSCLLEYGAAPLEYFVALAADKTEFSSIRKRANVISEQIVSNRIVDHINNYSKLSIEEKNYLKSISYFNTGFSLVKVSDALNSYNNQKLD